LERGRIVSSAYEELGWADGRLATALASTVPRIVIHAMGNHNLLTRYPEDAARRVLRGHLLSTGFVSPVLAFCARQLLAAQAEEAT
jgi:hypothetical protein